MMKLTWRSDSDDTARIFDDKLKCTVLIDEKVIAISSQIFEEPANGETFIVPLKHEGSVKRDMINYTLHESTDDTKGHLFKIRFYLKFKCVDLEDKDSVTIQSISYQDTPIVHNIFAFHRN